jgi:hypothetical protein
LANPHGGDQWNKSTNTARKINFSLWVYTNPKYQ